MPRRELWKHRRTASQSNVYPTPTMLSPTQKRERRLKTRSFDCPRSLSRESALEALDLEFVAQRLARAASVTREGGAEPSLSIAVPQFWHGEASAPPTPEPEDDYQLDPEVEQLLQAKFREMGDFVEAVTGDREPQVGRRCEEPSHRRRHRRSQSILFRTEASEAEERELAGDMASAFAGFDFCAEQRPEQLDFEQALANALSAAAAGESVNSPESRPASPLNTVREEEFEEEEEEEEEDE